MNGHWGDCNPSTCPMSASPATTTAAPTSSCSTPCQFPFIYQARGRTQKSMIENIMFEMSSCAQGVVHTACTYAGGFSPAWCSTKTDKFGKHVIGNFADCGTGCPVEITTG